MTNLAKPIRMKASQLGFNPDYEEDTPTLKQVSELIGYAILEFGTPWCRHCQAGNACRAGSARRRIRAASYQDL